MTCQDVRLHLHDFRRHRLAAELAAEVRAHLEGCPGCSQVQEAEALLDELLERRLPHHAAPPALKRRLAGMLAPAPRPRAEPRRWHRLAAPALAAGVALVAGVLVGQAASRERRAFDEMVSEAVGDHLRVLVAASPLELKSSGSHQVKPWFEGRLDFAPEVPTAEAPDFRLEGSAVGYFIDRRAAVIEYALRQHRVTLLAFRAEGLTWPLLGSRRLGPVEARVGSLRGFHVVLWRAGELGYALVSDVNRAELEALAGKLAATTAAPPAP